MGKVPHKVIEIAVGAFFRPRRTVVPFGDRYAFVASYIGLIRHSTKKGEKRCAGYEAMRSKRENYGKIAQYRDALCQYTLP